MSKDNLHYQCPLCGVGFLFDPFGSDWRPACGDVNVLVTKLDADAFQVTVGEVKIDCSRFTAKRLADALKVMLREREKP